VTELEQLALNSLVSPALILPGYALEENGHRVIDGRTPEAMWICPLLGDQATMPAQDSARRDRVMPPQHREQSRTSAANTARSAQSRRGLGLALRSTATS
jgi:hypothetical protein